MYYNIGGLYLHNMECDLTKKKCDMLHQIPVCHHMILEDYKQYGIIEVIGHCTTMVYNIGPSMIVLTNHIYCCTLVTAQKVSSIFEMYDILWTCTYLKNRSSLSHVLFLATANKEVATHCASLPVHSYGSSSTVQ